MATAPDNVIGATLSINVGTPVAETDSGYEALSYVEIADVLSVPETGDKTVANNAALLKTGVRKHYNGEKFVDPFTVPYIFSSTDAGQALVRANVNGSTEVTLKLTDADGIDYYIQAVLADLVQAERTPNAFKGESFTVRPILGSWYRITS